MPDEDNEYHLYQRAVGLIVVTGKVSTSFVQRRLEIGFNQAKRLVERAEADGIITKGEVLLKAKSASF